MLPQDTEISFGTTAQAGVGVEVAQLVDVIAVGPPTWITGTQVV